MKITGIISSAVVAAVLCFTPVGNAKAADQSGIREVIRQLVALYQGYGHLRYNETIDLGFIEEDIVNAAALYDPKTGDIGLRFFRKLLADFTPAEVTIVVCHELGHILGDVAHSSIPNRIKESPFSVEGEADYFAGKCAVSYFYEIEGLDYNGAQEKTFFAAASVMAKLYEVEALGQKAERDRFPDGINPTYPDPNCRVLSVWNGAEGKQRPKCWFNPRSPRSGT